MTCDKLRKYFEEFVQLKGLTQVLAEGVNDQPLSPHPLARSINMIYGVVCNLAMLTVLSTRFLKSKHLQQFFQEKGIFTKAQQRMARGLVKIGRDGTGQWTKVISFVPEDIMVKDPHHNQPLHVTGHFNGYEERRMMMDAGGGQLCKCYVHAYFVGHKDQKYWG
uniref:Uncharacterized protein n=1 Tax=Nelumbo nucifera TaxID=4432 RepID=A0A822ZG87_NELNU|nr:TPA_asm: hypothetical protein HUJ06_001833 [Nelumbo nucifera]